MKRPSYTLKIENPCKKNWDLMEPSSTGKFCQHCQHSVIDFSRLTDNEVLEIIEKSEGRICGRFDPNQLNRLMAQSAGPAKNLSLYKILAGLLLLSSPTLVPAQQTTLKTPFISDTPQLITSSADSSTTKTPTLYSGNNIISGTVIDANSKRAIDYAVVSILNTKTSVMANEKGEFRLVIPDSLLNSELVLKVTQIGYEAVELALDKNLNFKQSLLIGYPAIDNSKKILMLPLPTEYIGGMVSVIPCPPQFGKHRKK